MQMDVCAHQKPHACGSNRCEVGAVSTTVSARLGIPAAYFARPEPWYSNLLCLQDLIQRTSMSSAPPADDDTVEHIDPENTALRSGVRLNAGAGTVAPAFWQRLDAS